MSHKDRDYLPYQTDLKGLELLHWPNERPKRFRKPRLRQIAKYGVKAVRLKLIRVRKAKLVQQDHVLTAEFQKLREQIGTRGFINRRNKQNVQVKFVQTSERRPVNPGEFVRAVHPVRDTVARGALVPEEIYAHADLFDKLVAWVEENLGPEAAAKTRLLFSAEELDKAVSAGLIPKLRETVIISVPTDNWRVVPEILP